MSKKIKYELDTAEIVKTLDDYFEGKTSLGRNQYKKIREQNFKEIK